MGQKQAMSANQQAGDEAFLDVLRHALNHLYDPEQLRNSPLINLLLPEGQRQAAAKLQQQLLDAIQALRPVAGEAPGSVQRRMHQVLQLRYEQQFSQKEVAVQMGLSVRQYRRLQQTAIEALAFHLVEQHALGDHLAGLPAVPSPAPAAAGLAESLQWILALSHAETTRLDGALPDVLRLVQPLAVRNQKRLALQGNLAGIAAIHPLVLRQAMLHLLNAAILHTPGSGIMVTSAVDQRHVTVSVRTDGESAAASDDPARRHIEEEIVRQMLHAVGAELRIDNCGDGWLAELHCACVQEQPVLVIDDHPETIDLLKRSLEGTRYRLVATCEPQQALDLAQTEQPFLVLLDVMMPNVDGWEVLTRLKQHETTAALPVWVCTVLDQSELAFSLGADGFLRKPVTRERLLAVLDAQMDGEPARR